MSHSLYEFLPSVALGLFLLATPVLILRAGAQRSTAWLLPAGLSALFLAWSVFALVSEGLSGVWLEHSRNAWGNQIWFDLLLAIGTGWALLLPRARAAGMQAWPWLALIVCTGSVGLLAMFARCLFLENRHSPT